jgi:hypothetical protein
MNQAVHPLRPVAQIKCEPQRQGDRIQSRFHAIIHSPNVFRMDASRLFIFFCCTLENFRKPVNDLFRTLQFRSEHNSITGSRLSARG